MSILIETDIIKFPMFWSKKWVDRLICTGTWKKDITLQTLEISTLVHLICKEFRTSYPLATINLFLSKREYCFATSNISWEKSVFWPKKSNKKVVIIKGEGPKEPFPPALELHHPQRILLEASMARPLLLLIQNWENSWSKSKIQTWRDPWCNWMCTQSTTKRTLGANFCGLFSAALCQKNIDLSKYEEVWRKENFVPRFFFAKFWSKMAKQLSSKKSSIKQAGQDITNVHRESCFEKFCN